MSKKKEKHDEVAVIDEISYLVNKAIIRYCIKSEEKVNQALILKALADVMAGQLAVLSHKWTDDQTEEAVDSFLGYIAHLVNECRKLPDPCKDCNDITREILAEYIGADEWDKE